MSLLAQAGMLAKSYPLTVKGGELLKPEVLLWCEALRALASFKANRVMVLKGRIDVTDFPASRGWLLPPR
jgi:hypothetical protein